MQTQTQALTQEMEKVSFSCAAFAVHTCEPRQRKRQFKKGESFPLFVCVNFHKCVSVAF